MSQPIHVTIPLLNPNEPEALLSALHVTEGQSVSKGDPLCTLETTKSASDLEAQADGFVVGLGFSQGDTLAAGELLCYIAADPSWAPAEPIPSERSTTQTGTGGSQVPEGLRITGPALELAGQHGLDLGQLPLDRLVTEGVVRAYVQAGQDQETALSPSDIDPTLIFIYGGGGHGKAIIDLLRALRTYQIIGLVDDGIPSGESIMGLPVLGSGEVLSELYQRGIRLAVNAVGGIGNIGVRIQVFQKLSQAGFACPAVVHPTAFIEPSAALSPGVQVFPNAYVGSEARLGFGCIVNTGAVVSHDCILGDCANISPGALLAGEVQVGAGALIGMGATVNLRARIGAGARVGNGATVKADVPEKGIVRAGTIWPD